MTDQDIIVLQSEMIKRQQKLIRALELRMTKAEAYLYYLNAKIDQTDRAEPETVAS